MQMIAPECFFGDKVVMKLRLKELLKSRNISQTSLADGVGVNKSFISDIANNKKLPSTTTLAAIAKFLDVEISALQESERKIAVAGKVGAGAAVDLVDAYAKGDGLYHVACPEDLPTSGVVAVEVVGDSMAPIIQSGDVLFFTRHFFGVDPAAVNHVSICETEDGRALVKHIRPGREPKTFDLHSANNSNQTEYATHLKWAAPLRRHIAKQDIQVL